MDMKPSGWSMDALRLADTGIQPHAVQVGEWAVGGLRSIVIAAQPSFNLT
jgi:hypothetical protein